MQSWHWRQQLGLDRYFSKIRQTRTISSDNWFYPLQMDLEKIYEYISEQRAFVSSGLYPRVLTLFPTVSMAAILMRSSTLSQTRLFSTMMALYLPAKSSCWAISLTISSFLLSLAIWAGFRALRSEDSIWWICASFLLRLRILLKTTRQRGLLSLYSSVMVR